MQRRAIVFLLLGWGLAFGAPLVAQGKVNALAIAAAGDLRGTLEDVKAAFESRNPGTRLDLSFGASGSLTAQIQQGAPFDLFLSADTGFPEQIRRAGLANQDGPFAYANGFLTLWVRRDLGLDLSLVGLRALLDPRIKRLALASAKVAPYGRVAESALAKVQLLEALRSKIVYGDNVAQAAQFLQGGAAEAGLISQSQARHPVMESMGVSWRVPEEIVPPLRQNGVILARSPAQGLARKFRDFLLGVEGQAILARHGFGRP